MPLDVLQGSDFANGQVRTPVLLPREGQVILDITNTHPTYTLVVGGALFGMKVRV
jgi:hypothetical protein